MDEEEAKGDLLKALNVDVVNDDVNDDDVNDDDDDDAQNAKAWNCLNKRNAMGNRNLLVSVGLIPIIPMGLCEMEWNV